MSEGILLGIGAGILLGLVFLLISKIMEWLGIE
jgi:hypothetical protein